MPNIQNNQLAQCYPGDINADGSYAVPGGVTSINRLSFSGCTALSVIMPSSVTSIDDWAFAGCTSLTSVTIPKSVISIGGWAFFRCTALTSVIIPSSVTSIGESAFWKCTSLTSITIPSSVTSIGGWVFLRCNALERIDIEAFSDAEFDRVKNLLPEDFRTKARHKQPAAYLDEAHLPGASGLGFFHRLEMEQKGHKPSDKELLDAGVRQEHKEKLLREAHTSTM